MLDLKIPNRPEWTEEALFLDYCEKYKLTYDAVVEANQRAEIESRGYIGGTLASSYRKFYEREYALSGDCAALAHEHAVLSVVRLATNGK
jgi:hypothetical protein